MHGTLAEMTRNDLNVLQVHGPCFNAPKPNAIQLAKILKFGFRMVQIWNGWLHSFSNSCSYGPNLSKSEQKIVLG